MSVIPSWSIDWLTVSGDETTDSQGRSWVCNGEEGFLSSAPTRTDRTARAGASGSYRGPAYRDERTLGLSGSVWTQTPGQREEVEMALASLCSDPNRLYPLRRWTDTYDYTFDVELDDAPLIGMTTLWRVDWSFQFAAPDPRRHHTTWQQPQCGLPLGGTGRGLDFSFGGVDFEGAQGTLDFGGVVADGFVQVGNLGNAPAYPLISIEGPVSQPTITEPATGARMTYAGDLAVGDTLTINCDSFERLGTPGHGVYVNGARRRSSLSRYGDWFEVGPGQIGYYQFSAGAYSADARMTVSLRAAWH